MTKKTQFSIRLEADLKDYLAARAAENTRTLNLEIVSLLRAARDRDEKSKAASTSSKQ